MEIRAIDIQGAFIDPSTAHTETFAANHRRFLECASCCHDLKNAGDATHGMWIGDPMEIALARMATTALTDGVAFERVDEIPFDPNGSAL
jgi:magnesium-transporting ATPase (P-type)